MIRCYDHDVFMVLYSTVLCCAVLCCTVGWDTLFVYSIAASFDYEYCQFVLCDVSNWWAANCSWDVIILFSPVSL